MVFMKKIFFGLAFLFLISMGGAGTQSNSILMQGIGFFGIIIGLIVLYVFGKMVWRSIGCLPSFLILSAIVLFIMYSLGMFNNGLGGVGDAILKFIGRETTTSASQENSGTNMSFDTRESDEIESEAVEGRVYKNKINADFSDKSSNDSLHNASLYGDESVSSHEKVVKERKQENKSNGGFISGVISSLSGKQEPKQQKPFNPNDYPVVYGSVRVVNGDTLIMYGNYFKLYGIDAPESNQMCANRSGRSYNCGREAAMWLKNWIGDNELECHVIRQNTKGDMEGTCSYGPYDLGAALVNAGWAVANVNVTDIYYPYEMQAQENTRGLWQGQFYMPWDWRKMQARKPKIKVVTKKKKKGMFGI